MVMPLDPLRPKSPLVPALAILLALGLAGCASDGPVKGLAEATGLATTPQESKTFVQETRPADSQYIPVGRRFGNLPLCRESNAPPTGAPTSARGHIGTFPISQAAPDTCKPKAQFKAIEAGLEAKRISNEAAGSQAQSLGKALPPPKPSVVVPTN
ncbi:hypothetical protein [Bosea sp. PAMC 26642]|uniref:hypothetical protein n=1 Tax=Bosea sp. (strain PAMC 26642) TaxID=1792307 RepID=UPI0007704DB6|nr:hypothetical protein [Bosea sp. PAMC 26642]AMJ59577.1 hypothetical protein AXW83_04000 [Bosea sp. PAMC 26642]